MLSIGPVSVDAESNTGNPVAKNVIGEIFQRLNVALDLAKQQGETKW